MITISEIEQAIENGDIALWEVEGLARKLSAASRLRGEKARMSGLSAKYMPHLVTVRSTRPTKEGDRYRIDCNPCGLVSRHVYSHEALGAAENHRHLSGWQRRSMR